MASRLKRPAEILGKLVARAKELLRRDPDLASMIRHNRAVWKGWANPRGEAQILVDFFPIYGHYLGRCYAANILAKKFGARITAFHFHSFWNRKLVALYRSFNTSEFLRVRFSPAIRVEAESIAVAEFGKIKTKWDLLNFEWDGLNIGLDIYETYLRECSRPTLDFMDPRLRAVFVKGVATLLFWKEHFDRVPVKAVIISHNNYIAFNVVARTAIKRGIPVYLPSADGCDSLRNLDGPYDNFREYRRMFSALPVDQRQEAVGWAKEQMNKRFSGAVGVDMHYSTKSAFTGRRASRLTREGDRVKVLICTHCFFDNPHGYSKLLVPDFYEWLKLLNTIAGKTDFDWYIKTHPDYLPGTLETIEAILGPDSRIGILPPDASHLQLADEGVDYVLTVYGTVGFEYPLLGVQVVNLGYNPRVSYDFNFHACSIEEYEKLLLSLGGRPKKEIKPEDVYEAYFMFYRFTKVDDFIFPSTKQFLRDNPGPLALSSKSYAYFLERWSETRHQAIIGRLEKFFASGEAHLYLS